MADYLVVLTNGQNVTIAGVTATPTMVQNDGTATKIKGPPYRDLFTPVSSMGVTALSGHRTVPTYAGSPPAVSAYAVVTDDLTSTPKVPPKQAEEEWTHWKFVCGSFSYFIPVRFVMAMCTTVND